MSYLNDYKELQKTNRQNSEQFMKDHPIGTVVMTVISLAFAVAPLALPAIKSKIDAKLEKRKAKKEEIINEWTSPKKIGIIIDPCLLFFRVKNISIYD